MYILNPILHSEINAAILRVKRQLPQLEFDEFIAIPAFGSNIILRFDYIGDERITLDALDSMETKLREDVGNDFMANLMGDASRQCGLDFSHLNDILIRIDENKSASIHACPAHCEGLNADCATIRRLFDLPNHFPIWEIQYNPEGLLVLALYPMDEQPPFTDKESKLDGYHVRVRFLPDDGSFRGLMKAATIASENSVSIAHVLLDYSVNL